MSKCIDCNVEVGKSQNLCYNCLMERLRGERRSKIIDRFGEKDKEKFLFK